MRILILGDHPQHGKWFGSPTTRAIEAALLKGGHELEHVEWPMLVGIHSSASSDHNRPVSLTDWRTGGSTSGGSLSGEMFYNDEYGPWAYLGEIIAKLGRSPVDGAIAFGQGAAIGLALETLLPSLLASHPRFRFFVAVTQKIPLPTLFPKHFFKKTTTTPTLLMHDISDKARERPDYSKCFERYNFLWMDDANYHSFKSTDSEKYPRALGQERNTEPLLAFIQEHTEPGYTDPELDYTEPELGYTDPELSPGSFSSSEDSHESDESGLSEDDDAVSAESIHSPPSLPFSTTDCSPGESSPATPNDLDPSDSSDFDYEIRSNQHAKDVLLLALKQYNAIKRARCE